MPTPRSNRAVVRTQRRRRAPEYEELKTITIYQSEDYSQFNLGGSTNREVRQEGIEKIKKALKTINMMDIYPVIVDEDFTVFDGQHRLKAAEQMGIPFYFIFKDGGFSHEQLLMVNTSRTNWSIRDVMIVQSRMGNGHARRLLNLKDALEWRDEVTMYMMGHGSWRGTPLRACTVKDMVWEDEHEENFRVIYRKLMQCSCLPFWQTRNFVKAFVLLNNLRRFDFNHFTRQFIEHKDMIKNKNKLEILVSEMVKMYNHETPRGQKISYSHEDILKFQRS